MGNIAAGIADAQKKNMEAQQKQMIAMQMAASRDLCMWIGGVWSTLLAGAMISRNKMVLAPLSVVSVVLAYNLDMAYGGKMERIRAEHYRIINNEQHWFNLKQNDLKLEQKVKSELLEQKKQQ
ncbi:hypothetical protein MIR68_002356 [Amoeboaphelidium protococcarum]|nr:hypothetical protein MIR68_002356 [Amoeboaphelidium protococcarum]